MNSKIHGLIKIHPSLRVTACWFCGVFDEGIVDGFSKFEKSIILICDI